MKSSNAHQSILNRTGADLRAEFERRGLSIAEWARSNGFSSALVYQVLAGRKRCVRGQSHQIAVKLGLKNGEIGTVHDIGKRLPAGSVAPDVTQDPQQKSGGST